LRKNEGKYSMKKRIFWIFGILLVFLVAGGVYIIVRANQESTTTATVGQERVTRNRIGYD
jgi:hypothetical protein